MACPDSSWFCHGELSSNITSTGEVEVTWKFQLRILRGFLTPRGQVKSENFLLDGATWTIFALFYERERESQFGIYVRKPGLSDKVFNSCSNISFKLRNRKIIKNIECKIKFNTANSIWVVRDFFTKSELEEFLMDDGYNIVCRINIKQECSQREILHSSKILDGKACIQTHLTESFQTEIPHSSRALAVEACIQTHPLESFQTEIPHSGRIHTVEAYTQTRLPEISILACQDWKWLPCGGELSIRSVSIAEQEVTWDISSFLRECVGEQQTLASDKFVFAHATWNLYLTFGLPDSYGKIGLYVERDRSSVALLDCHSNISFQDLHGKDISSFEIKLKRGKVLFVMKDFLLNSELHQFLQDGALIVCRISMKKSSNKCSQAEITHLSGTRAVDAHTQDNFPEKKDEEIPKINPIYKVCQDFKQLLLSEEGSDLTIQVKDQQFKAHRSILTARSSVFASMFRHSTSEKATEVVNVEDCEPSAFPVLLDYLYYGSTEKISIQNVFAVYTAAFKYNVQDLKINCLEFITNNLSVDTFCETLRLSLQDSETNLSKLTVDFFGRNMRKIIITDKWKIFMLESPLQVNELLIKAMPCDTQDDQPL